MVARIIEALGAALIVTGAAVLAPWLAFVVAGVALVLAAQAVDQ